MLHGEAFRRVAIGIAVPVPQHPQWTSRVVPTPTQVVSIAVIPLLYTTATPLNLNYCH
jgi:hypothetical protein